MNTPDNINRFIDMFRLPNNLKVSPGFHVNIGPLITTRIESACDQVIAKTILKKKGCRKI